MRVRAVLLIFAIVIVACAPSAVSGTTSSEVSPAAPTPRASEGAPISRPATAGSCAFSTPSADGLRNVFVAIAARGSDGVAFVLDSATGSERSRMRIEGTPEAAVDWVGGRLITFCGSRLVAFDLSTLRENWQIPIDDRSITKAPGGLPALAVGSDGRFVFVLHYKTLRPGDAYAPGTSITWLTGQDARTGAEVGRVDFPDCVAARIFVASDETPYVMCRDQLHAIETSTWSVARTFPFSGSVGPVGIVGDRTIYGITHELDVVAMDLRTGTTVRIGKGSNSKATAQAWGRLTAEPNGSTVYVIAKASGDRLQYDPDTLAVVGVDTWSVSETHIPGLRGVGLVGTRVVYGAGGRLRSTDGAIDRTLIEGPVEYWHIFDE